MRYVALLSLSLLFSATLSAQDSRDLKVLIKDVEHAEAQTWVLLYEEGAGILTEDAPVTKREILQTDKGRGMVSFSDLEDGRYYAILAFSDMNGNGILDRKNGGRPAEPFVWTELGSFRDTPGFSDAAFELKSQTQAVLLEMTAVRYKAQDAAQLSSK